MPKLNSVKGAPLGTDPIVLERPVAGEGTPFKLVSPFEPAGDQPQAIEQLTEGLVKGERDQVLLGVTGSGKTYTMAHVIQRLQRRPWCSPRTRPSPPSSMAR